jgi:predicted DCC family thiol-disulfide oxidoreductase YuxK
MDRGGCARPGLTLVYDGDCPLCSAYVTRFRLEAAAGPLRLITARSEPALVVDLARRGYRLDDGLVALVGEQIYQGADALHLLALMGGRSGWLNRLSGRLFRSARLSRAVYPSLVAGWRVLPRMLGRSAISGPEAPMSGNQSG